jgi:hypothetical protein
MVGLVMTVVIVMTAVPMRIEFADPSAVAVVVVVSMLPDVDGSRHIDRRGGDNRGGLDMAWSEDVVEKNEAPDGDGGPFPPVADLVVPGPGLGYDGKNDECCDDSERDLLHG